MRGNSSNYIPEIEITKKFEANDPNQIKVQS